MLDKIQLDELLHAIITQVESHMPKNISSEHKTNIILMADVFVCGIEEYQKLIASNVKDD